MTRQERKAVRVAARAALTEARRARRRVRRGERSAALAALGRRLRPVLPIGLVTALAMYGQINFAYSAIVGEIADQVVVAAVLAVAMGVAYESISLHVQWHAHDSLMRGHTLTASRQRRASYLIAGVGAAVNYSHYAGDRWQPTVLAVCFATFSLASPPLWGLHTRRAHEVQLSREGQLDSAGAVFSAERYRWFPWRTFGALRWSIDHGVADPRTAWVGYNAERAARGRPSPRVWKFRRPTPPTPAQEDPTRAEWPTDGDLEAHLAQVLRVTEPVGDGQRADWAALGHGAGELLDRRESCDTSRDASIIADLRALESAHGRRWVRDEVKVMYGIGSTKAERVLTFMGWMPRDVERAEVGG